MKIVLKDTYKVREAVELTAEEAVVAFAHGRVYYCEVCTYSDGGSPMVVHAPTNTHSDEDWTQAVAGIKKQEVQDNG